MNSAADGRTADIAAVLHRLGGGDGYPDVVMIHGFGADRLSWTANAPYLFDAFRVWGVDLPGHGDAEPLPAAASLTLLTGSVVTALERMIPGPVHLLGHSLGGAVAIEVAARIPSRVRSISLIAPAGLGKGIDRDFVALLPQLQGDEAALLLLQRLVSRPRLINRAMVTRILDHLERPGRREALASAGESLRAIESELAGAVAAIERNGIPHLTIWGEADSINPIDRERLAGFGGEQHVVASAGHMPQVEDFKAVNAWLKAFLTNHS